MGPYALAGQAVAREDFISFNSLDTTEKSQVIQINQRTRDRLFKPTFTF